MREINYTQDVYHKIYLDASNVAISQMYEIMILNKKYAKRKRIIDKLLADNQ